MALFQSPICSTLDSDPVGQLGMSDYINQRTRHQPVGRDSSTCTQVIWIFFWLIVLVLVAYPVALMAAILYAILNPLSLMQCSQPLIELLLAALNLPLTCARNLVDAKQLIVM